MKPGRRPLTSPWNCILMSVEQQADIRRYCDFFYTLYVLPHVHLYESTRVHLYMLFIIYSRLLSF